MSNKRKPGVKTTSLFLHICIHMKVCGCLLPTVSWPVTCPRLFLAFTVTFLSDCRISGLSWGQSKQNRVDFKLSINPSSPIWPNDWRPSVKSQMHKLVTVPSFSLSKMYAAWKDSQTHTHTHTHTHACTHTHTHRMKQLHFAQFLISS